MIFWRDFVRICGEPVKSASFFANQVGLVMRPLLIFAKHVGFVAGEMLILVTSVGFVVRSCCELECIMSCLLSKNTDVVSNCSRETIIFARTSFALGVVGSAKAVAFVARKVAEFRDFSRKAQLVSRATPLVSQEFFMKSTCSSFLFSQNFLLVLRDLGHSSRNFVAKPPASL